MKKKDDHTGVNTYANFLKPQDSMTTDKLQFIRIDTLFIHLKNNLGKSSL